MHDGYKLFAVYDFYIDADEMANRCPTALYVGPGVIRDHRLVFRGPNAQALATVEPTAGAKAPVVVWNLTAVDEAALDAFEGFPARYRKEQAKVNMAHKSVRAAVYILNAGALPLPLAQPSSFYFATMYNGYKKSGADLSILQKALTNSAVPASDAEK